MKNLSVFLTLSIFLTVFNANATFLPVSQDFKMANCYPGSPMLQSDVCWGQVHNPVPPTQMYDGPLIRYPQEFYQYQRHPMQMYYPYYHPYAINNYDRFYNPKIDHRFRDPNRYYPTVQPGVHVWTGL